MRTYVNFRDMQEMAGKLNLEKEALERMLEEVCLAGEEIRDLSWTEETMSILAKTKTSLEEEIRDLSQMARVLEETAAWYRQAQERIVDHYNGENVTYPRPGFGSSKFDNLEQYRSLMPFEPIFSDRGGDGINGRDEL